jgi:hypothetical protein
MNNPAQLRPRDELLEYRKTATILAVQYLGQHVEGVCTGGQACLSRGAPDDSVPHIHTLEGDLTVSRGDWVATGVKGEHWAIKPDVFAASYEPVSAISEAAERIRGETEREAEANALVRRLDVALNGEDGAAAQAPLCDIVGQIEDQRWRLIRADGGDLDDGPGRVAFVRSTLTRLMEENGGPHSRQANITLSGSTIAEWLLRLGEVPPEIPPAPGVDRETVAVAIAPFMFPNLGDVAAQACLIDPTNYDQGTQLGCAVSAILAALKNKGAGE